MGNGSEGRKAFEEDQGKNSDGHLEGGTPLNGTLLLTSCPHGAHLVPTWCPHGPSMKAGQFLPAPPSRARRQCFLKRNVVAQVSAVAQAILPGAACVAASAGLGERNMGSKNMQNPQREAM